MSGNGLSETENDTLPGAINDSWRTWLMTGARRVPLDPRRMQGAHRGLKKILGEGLENVAESPYTWKDFSGAMVRHAVGDALHALPEEDTKVVKLAYFGGYSNREIARHVGLTETAVQRRLRRALAAISDHIQHGRALGRRALYAIGVFLTGRWLSEPAHQAWQAAAVAGAAAVVVATAQPIAPAGQATRGASGVQHAPAATTTVVPPVPSPTSPVTVPQQAAAQAPVVQAPGLQAPSVQAASVQLPAVTVPSLPPVPKVKKVL
jgi:RNA polymerase sigma factor (sigma-70 family)